MALFLILVAVTFPTNSSDGVPVVDESYQSVPLPSVVKTASSAKAICLEIIRCFVGRFATEYIRKGMTMNEVGTVLGTPSIVVINANDTSCFYSDYRVWVSYRWVFEQGKLKHEGVKTVNWVGFRK